MNFLESLAEKSLKKKKKSLWGNLSKFSPKNLMFTYASNITQ